MAGRTTDLSPLDRLALDAKQWGRRFRKSVKNAALAFRPDEVGYRLAIGTFGGMELAYRSGTVDEQVIAHTINENGLLAIAPGYRMARDHVILDVGAHIGAFAVAAARAAPAGRVLAVEASEETCNYLRINRALNQVVNLEIDRVALAGSSGRTTLHHDVGSWGHSIVKRLSGRGEEVATESLADFFARKQVSRCDFAKFNCEGAEFPILLAASRETLRIVQRMLVLFHGDLVSTHLPSDLTTHLERAGFAVEVTHQPKRPGRGWINATRL